jgi:signal transduction histidine kinase/CheY-like chemotaxis protein
MNHNSASRAVNVRELQSQAIEWVSLFLLVIGYAWLLGVIWPETGDRTPAGSWIGAASLAVGATAGFLLRRARPTLAALVLIAGTLGAVTAALLAYRAADLVYLYLLPLLLASVLIGRRGLAAIAGLCIALAIFIPISVIGLTPTSRYVWLPASVLTLAAAAYALATHNAQVSLAWMWHGYEQAEHNERLATDRQAELRRVLKTLDETTYRLERANTELAQSRNRAEDARRLKQQFAQTISHELRTPLNLVVGFTDLITQSPEYYGAPLPPAYQRDLAIVARNARHLQSLVNDVLDLARIEAAEMTIIPEETAPAALAREAVATAESAIQARGLALITEIAPDLPTLWVDPTRIRQVLFNLLNNASRFTEHGQVTVKVSRRGSDIEFAVADTGIGIAPEDLGRIFDEFQQADGTRRRRHGGAGLGLAISRRFVQLHGGRIWAESQVGRGSTFYFTLPVAARGEGVAGEERSKLPDVARVEPETTPVLLVVTRSPTGVGLIARYLPGCRTVIAAELGQARAAAERLLPQGVLIDTLHTPMSGEALQSLADAWALTGATFMACPLPGEGALQNWLDVAGYLIKPVTRERLWDALRPLGEGVDRILVVDDDRDFARLVTRMLDHPVRRYQVYTADSGRRALDLLAAHPFDLILLDMALPDMDGEQIIAAVRADPGRAALPIVVVSGQDETMLKSPAAGPLLLAHSDGLAPAELLRWLRAWLNARGAGPAGP